jgi:hypothetical protein
MSTVMYEDVADDVKEKGYVAISHVWGDQQMYSADKLGILGGVDWRVPLSNTNKISRLVEAMNHYEKEYCWFDILCMPQDKQDEINLEIPFMGDYYNGADMTFVLATAEYTISKDYQICHDITLNVVNEERDYTLDELDILSSYQHPLLDMSKEVWFKRVWTFQEAVLSDHLVLLALDGSRLDLSNTIMMMGCMAAKNLDLSVEMFGDSMESMGPLFDAITNRDSATLGSTCSSIFFRECHKQHDKFYGILGVLGYRDFAVDYQMPIDDLNRKMAKYAYSNGDLSWITIRNGPGNGFVQPMYNAFRQIGLWEEDIPGICGIKLDDAFHINTVVIGKVICYKSIDNTRDRDVLRQIVYGFLDWGLDEMSITRAVMGFRDTDLHMAKVYIDLLLTDLDELDLVGEFSKIFPIEQQFQHLFCIRDNLRVLAELGDVVSITMVRGIPLIVSGSIDVGDNIMATRMCGDGRTLGIIASDLGECKAMYALYGMKIPARSYTSRGFLL